MAINNIPATFLITMELSHPEDSRFKTNGQHIRTTESAVTASNFAEEACFNKNELTSTQIILTAKSKWS